MEMENLKCSFKEQCLDVCRLCAKRSEHLIPIFTEEGRKQDIKIKIDMYLPVKVECDDFLPVQVCDECVSAMTTWDHFSANCLAAEQQLLAMTCSECTKIHDVPDDIGDRSSSNHTAIINNNPVQNEIGDKPSEAEDSDLPSTQDITSRECSSEGQKMLVAIKREIAGALLILLKRKDKNKEPSNSDKKFEESPMNSSPTTEMKTHHSKIGEQNVVMKSILKTNVYKVPLAAESLEASKDRSSGVLNDYVEENYQDEKNNLLINSGHSLHDSYSAVSEKDKIQRNHLDQCQQPCFSLKKNKKLVETIKTQPVISVARDLDHSYFKVPTALESSEQSNVGIAQLKGYEYCDSSSTVAFQNHDEVQNSFQCQLCGVRVEDSSALAVHKRTHLICRICEEEFVYLAAIKKHMNSHSVPWCSVCIQVFDNEEVLQSHLLTHPGRYTLCDICGKAFMAGSAFRRHFRSHLSSCDRRLFKCNICDKRFTRKSYLRNHSITHGSKKQFICEVCGKTFYTSAQLRLHSRCHLDIRPFCCEVCNASFKWKRNLQIHSKVHSRSQRFDGKIVCDICGKMISEINISVHKQRHGNREPVFSCTVCGKKLLSKGSLDRHLNLHQGLLPFKCSMCGRGFSTKISRDNHVRTHTGEKPYECKVCHKRFCSAPALCIHRLIHTDIRKFPCSMCSSRFRRRIQLRRHLLTHTGEKPYSCCICSRAFSQKIGLEKHIAIHSDVKPFVCECGARFKQKEYLQKHQKKHTFKIEDICAIPVSSEIIISSQ